MNRSPRPPSSRSIPGYRVLRTLGRGALGTVHLGQREADGRFVAIKWVHRDAGASELVREAEITAQLVHPNIIDVIETGSLASEDGGDDLFVAMEYCPGGDLQQRIQRRGGSLDLDEALSVTRQLLDALAFAHASRIEIDDCAACGVIHCDIKPQNLLLGTAHEGGPLVKVTDFGLAQAAFAGAGAAFGTLPFMAREQLEGRALPQTDVFGAAATLYYMLTGSPPRDFGVALAPEHVVLGRAPIPILNRLPLLPPALAGAIDRALHDSLSERTPSVLAFQADLGF